MWIACGKLDDHWTLFFFGHLTECQDHVGEATRNAVVCREGVGGIKAGRSRIAAGTAAIAG